MWLRAMGGGAKPKPIERTYFVKNGVCQVEWEYPFSSSASYATVANNWTITDDSFVGESVLSTNSSCALTKFPIDMTDYGTIYFVTSFGTHKLDVSSVSGTDNHIYLAMFNGSGTRKANIGISTTKSTCITNSKVNLQVKSVNTTYTWNIYDIYAEPKEYLYKDGTQNVEWDNTGYNLYSQYTNDGGFTLLNNSAEAPSVASNHSRCLMSNVSIDVSDYAKLNIQYNGTKTYSIDISDVNASAYIGIFFYNSSVDTYVIALLNNTKEGIATNPYTSTDNWVQTSSLVINRIWLEK